MAQIPQCFLDQIEEQKIENFKRGYLQAVATLLPGSEYLNKVADWYLKPNQPKEPPIYD